MGVSRPPSLTTCSLGCATRRILLNYAVYNPATGYSQGMSDLVAPILAEVLDESDTFWCFVGLMQNTTFVSSPRDEDMEKQLVRLPLGHVWRGLGGCCGSAGKPGLALSTGCGGLAQGLWERASCCSPVPGSLLSSPPHSPSRLRVWVARVPPRGSYLLHTASQPGVPSGVRREGLPPGPSSVTRVLRCILAAACGGTTQSELLSGDRRGEAPEATLRPAGQWSHSPHQGHWPCLQSPGSTLCSTAS